MMPQTWPSIMLVASWLRAASRSVDATPEGCDVRLQVYPDGSAAIRVGDSSYDLDHHGFWGASFVPGGKRRFNSYELARELLDQAKEQHAQEVG